MTASTATLGSFVKAVGLKGELKLLPGPDFWTKALAFENLDLVSEDDRRVSVRVERFRPKGNTYILKLSGIETRSDAEPMVGSRLDIAGVRLKVVDVTERCDATNVDPASATRDTDVPALLRRHFSHSEFGVYATVETSGEMTVGAQIKAARA